MPHVTVTGATGLIGTRLVATLRADGTDVTVLSRDPQRARAKLERTAPPAQDGGSTESRGRSPESAGEAPPPQPGELRTLSWDPLRESAPVSALEGRDAVVHLAGENVAQRWSAGAKRAIRESRTLGTRHLVEGLAATAAGPGRPATLLSGSAIGYYGPRGEEPIDEEAPAGNDFLAQVCLEWEEQARAAQELGLRVVQIRTGVVLDSGAGALAKMLPPFRLGVGGPVAGGRQYVSWIHPHDHIEIVRAALADARWSGPVNATAPEPATNGELSRALGRALHRPALLPVPGVALRLLYGEMAQIVTTGARVLPAKALVLGFHFRYPHLEQALAAALA
jgi:uncharacterized protein (TIGR01777 family)